MEWIKPRLATCQVRPLGALSGPFFWTIINCVQGPLLALLLQRCQHANPGLLRAKYMSQ